jgi:hypothetical protein
MRQDTKRMDDIPDGITTHLKRKRGWSVRDRNVVEVTFRKPFDSPNTVPDGMLDPNLVSAKNAADLETGWLFYSAYRLREEDMSHTRNNWVCYHFQRRGLCPTHRAIRAVSDDSGNPHTELWFVEPSADGDRWRDVARQEAHEQLSDPPFPVAGVPLHLAGEHRQEPPRG